MVYRPKIDKLCFVKYIGQALFAIGAILVGSPTIAFPYCLSVALKHGSDRLLVLYVPCVVIGLWFMWLGHRMNRGHTP